MKKIMVLAVILVSVFMYSAVYAKGGCIINGKPKEVTVYIQDVKSSITGADVTADALKTTLIDTLKNRKSVKFVLADSPEKAAFVIDADIKEYVYLLEDPVDEIANAATTVIDALNKDNYSRMEVFFTVKNTATGRNIYSNSVVATVTQHVMPPKEGAERATARAADLFARVLSKVVCE